MPRSRIPVRHWSQSPASANFPPSANRSLRPRNFGAARQATTALLPTPPTELSCGQMVSVLYTKERDQSQRVYLAQAQGGCSYLLYRLNGAISIGRARFSIKAPPAQTVHAARASRIPSRSCWAPGSGKPAASARRSAGRPGTESPIGRSLRAARLAGIGAWRARRAGLSREGHGDRKQTSILFFVMQPGCSR